MKSRCLTEMSVTCFTCRIVLYLSQLMAFQQQRSGICYKILRHFLHIIDYIKFGTNLKKIHFIFYKFKFPTNIFPTTLPTSISFKILDKSQKILLIFYKFKFPTNVFSTTLPTSFILLHFVLSCNLQKGTGFLVSKRLSCIVYDIQTNLTHRVP